MHSTTPSTLGLLLTLAAVAHGREPNEVTFEVEYVAPPSCPDEAAFTAAIALRTPSARRVEAGQGTIHFRAEVFDDGSSSLSVTFPEGFSRREIPAVSCEEAVSSMAVIASMVLEASPESRLAMTDAPLPEPPPPSPAAPPPAPPATAPAAPPPPSAPFLDVPRRRATPVAHRRATGLRYGLGAGVAVESAVAPSPPPLATFGAELAWPYGRLWAPALGAQLVLGPETTETTADGDASFRLVAGRVNGCPLSLGLDGSLRLRPCVTLDAGGLRGEGGGVAENPKTVWATWLAPGLALRGELDVVTLARLEASVSVRWVPFHDRFVFRPGSLIYDIPPISLGFALGFSIWP